MSNTAQPQTESAAQFGALCWRAGKAGAEVLLISSRETGRWVIPKGWPMKGRTGPQAAEIEAWEEAGVKGQIADEKLGHFTYTKVLKRDTKKEILQPCIVEVFPLQVAKFAPEFPEQRQRRRKWFAPVDAARKVAEAELKAMLSAFNPTLPPYDPPIAKRKKR
ncbi:NUDIX hydrolase [Pseudorhodobacter ferrugineus]|uniref:NUDIX hydrolase n=1 Tax=Pseudorhodobacter ferrugineus TaxID=77008 RepID=UPI0003B44E57|nr:NUDIX hydrolase [Pseudorhodobacter ferrugineus]